MNKYNVEGKIDFNSRKYRIIDLSPRLVGTLRRLNGEIIQGNKTMDGVPWPLEEKETVNMDDSHYTAVGGWPDDPIAKWKINAHFGVHTEGGKYHIDHWVGLPDSMLGLWEYPLETFMGTAAVCNLSGLKPAETETPSLMKNAEGESVPWQGQAIMPEHLSNVQRDDIVLMYSPYRGKEMPYFPSETTDWLAKKGIKMLAVQLPGLAWETGSKLPPPHNSPTHRNMLGNNIPVTYPLANLELLKKDRVFYIGLPLSVENMDASWIRAIALEEL